VAVQFQIPCQQLHSPTRRFSQRFLCDITNLVKLLGAIVVNQYLETCYRLRFLVGKTEWLVNLPGFRLIVTGLGPEVLPLSDRADQCRAKKE
jgi:hypothetical protein